MKAVLVVLTLFLSQGYSAYPIPERSCENADRVRLVDALKSSKRKLALNALAFLQESPFCTVSGFSGGGIVGVPATTTYSYSLDEGTGDGFKINLAIQENSTRITKIVQVRD